MTDGETRQAATLIAASRRLVVLTGAGMSAPSGVPTFRGAGGLWGRYRAEELATPEAFARDPATVWAWYDWRRQQIAACVPNAGHEVLARWSHRHPQCVVVTQNVDGLHERAGTRDVLRLHGSIWRVRCVRGCPAGAEAERRDVPIEPCPPTCACGVLLRPAVVWFGEALDPAVWRDAETAVASADVVLVIGTSAQVYPAAGLVRARRGRTQVIEINPEPAVTDADLSLAASADVALLALERHLPPVD